MLKCNIRRFPDDFMLELIQNGLIEINSKQNIQDTRTEGDAGF